MCLSSQGWAPVAPRTPLHRAGGRLLPCDPDLLARVSFGSVPPVFVGAFACISYLSLRFRLRARRDVRRLAGSAVSLHVLQHDSCREILRVVM